MAVMKQTYTFKVVDDCEIKADVYRLSDDKIRPVIVWIHGGALIVGSRKGVNAHDLDMYVQAGYVLVSIDYRLAPETKLAAIIEDIQDAVTWVRGQGPNLFHIDPDRLTVVGHSAGGYLTLMTGFCVMPCPRALVSFYGYGDIAGAWYSKPDPFYCRQPPVSKEEAYGAVGARVISETPPQHNRHRFYLYCRQQGLWPKEVTGHNPDTDSAPFDQFCPVRNITPDYPPTLLLHGDKDTDVPYEQSVMMAKELAQHGVEHEFITIPGGGHGFKNANESTVARASDRVLDFLKRHAR